VIAGAVVIDPGQRIFIEADGLLVAFGVVDTDDSLGGGTRRVPSGEVDVEVRVRRVVELD
jgi:hypothetical protein